MSTVLRLSTELVQAAKVVAGDELRTVPKQIEYWARLGRELEQRRRAMQLLDPMTLMLTRDQAEAPSRPLDFTAPHEWAGLPGADLIARGLQDAARGEWSIEGVLLSVVAPRFERLGLDVPGTRWPNPEHALYGLLLARYGDDAHSQYNALLSRASSFANAMECAIL